MITFRSMLIVAIRRFNTEELDKGVVSMVQKKDAIIAELHER